MVTSETVNQHCSEFILAVQEDTIIGNEYVVEDNQSFCTAEFLVTNVDVVVLFELSCVAGLTTIDHEDTFSIYRYCEGNCIILVFFLHSLCGHYDNFVAVNHTCLVSLSTTYNNAVRTTLYNMQEHVGVSLLVRRKTSVTLGVCHSTVNNDVLLLNHLPEVYEVLMILCAVSFVDFICC